MYLETSNEAEYYLNRHAIRLSGKDVSFYVHYWGAVPGHYDNPLHKHSFFEVCYVIGGEGSYLDDGVVYPLRSETLFCSRPGIWHQIRSQTGLFLFYVAFEIVESASSEEAVRQFQQLENSRKFYVPEADLLSSALLWKALHLLAAKPQALLRETVVNLSHSLLVSFLQAFTDYQGFSSEKGQRSATTQLHQAKLFIRDNLSQPLRLNDVASYLHVSGRHLSRLFSSELGRTFTSYIRQERLQQAKTMLKTSHLSIKSIARETGFETVHYFTRIFTSEVGISPAKYRNEVLKNPAVKKE